MNDLKIHYLSPAELKPAIYNPRKWENGSIEQLTNSIKRFGLVDPIICNSSPKRKNIVIGGHFRLKIAKDLKYKKVPVVYINIPDINKEQELNLRLNKNTGEWDLDLLREFQIDTLLDVGFDNNELSEIWDEALEIEDDGFNQAKELAKIKTTNIKVGDIFKLGDHKLICGDATNPETIKKLAGKDLMDMVYSDPPFNIGLNYNKGISGKENYGGTTKDNKSKAEYKDFLTKSLRNSLEVSKKDLHVFYYCDQIYISLLQQIYTELGIDAKRICLWIKNGFNVTPQIAFNKSYEPCIYGTLGKPYLSPIKNLNEIMNKEVGTGNRTSEDIIDLIDIWLVKRLPGQDYEHPTEKPPNLHEKALKRCTKPGDKVLDVFAGSGSTLIACEQLKRRAYLCEIEPIFCQLIINRFETYAKQKAIKLN